MERQEGGSKVERGRERKREMEEGKEEVGKKALHK